MFMPHYTQYDATCIINECEFIIINNGYDKNCIELLDKPTNISNEVLEESNNTINFIKRVLDNLTGLIGMDGIETLLSMNSQELESLDNNEFTRFMTVKGLEIKEIKKLIKIVHDKATIVAPYLIENDLHSLDNILYKLDIIQYKIKLTEPIIKKYKKRLKLKKEKALKRKEDIGYIYIIECNQYYKIGKTKNIKSRLWTIQADTPYEINLIYNKEFPDYHTIEKELHKKFKHIHHKGEWFKLTNEDINYIKSL